jgi:hypothetical protein
VVHDKRNERGKRVYLSLGKALGEVTNGGEAEGYVSACKRRGRREKTDSRSWSTVSWIAVAEEPLAETSCQGKNNALISAKEWVKGR